MPRNNAELTDKQIRKEYGMSFKELAQVLANPNRKLEVEKAQSRCDAHVERRKKARLALKNANAGKQ